MSYAKLNKAFSCMLSMFLSIPVAQATCPLPNNSQE